MVCDIHLKLIQNTNNSHLTPIYWFALKMNERKETCSLFARVEIMWFLLLGVRGTEESESLLSQSTQTSTIDKSRQRL